MDVLLGDVEKLVRLPVEADAGMRAEIAVSEKLAPIMDDKYVHGLAVDGQRIFFTAAICHCRGLIEDDFCHGN